MLACPFLVRHINICKMFEASGVESDEGGGRQGWIRCRRRQVVLTRVPFVFEGYWSRPQCNSRYVPHTGKQRDGGGEHKPGRGAAPYASIRRSQILRTWCNVMQTQPSTMVTDHDVARCRLSKVSPRGNNIFFCFARLPTSCL